MELVTYTMRVSTCFTMANKVATKIVCQVRSIQDKREQVP